MWNETGLRILNNETDEDIFWRWIEMSVSPESQYCHVTEKYRSAYVSRRPRAEGYVPHGCHDAVGNCGRGNFPRFLDQFQECSFPPPSSSSATHTLGLLALGSSYEFLIQDHWNPSIPYKPKGAPRKKATLAGSFQIIAQRPGGYWKTSASRVPSNEHSVAESRFSFIYRVETSSLLIVRTPYRDKELGEAVLNSRQAAIDFVSSRFGFTPKIRPSARSASATSKRVNGAWFREEESRFGVGRVPDHCLSRGYRASWTERGTRTSTPRSSASEFALSSASHSSRGLDCAPRNRDCGFQAVWASSGSCGAARQRWSRFRRSPPRPSSRFRHRRRTACHWRRSSRCFHLKSIRRILFFLYIYIIAKDTWLNLSLHESTFQWIVSTFLLVDVQLGSGVM